MSSINELRRVFKKWKFERLTIYGRNLMKTKEEYQNELKTLFSR